VFHWDKPFQPQPVWVDTSGRAAERKLTDMNSTRFLGHASGLKH